jgi:hypothetical protein
VKLQTIAEKVDVLDEIGEFFSIAACVGILRKLPTISGQSYLKFIDEQGAKSFKNTCKLNRKNAL